MATVAARIGRNHPYVKDYEDGQRRLDVVQLMEVVWALDTTLTAIAEFLTDNPPPLDGSDLNGLPELLSVSRHDPSLEHDEDQRDVWYQEEWSRLCLLLKVARQRSQRPDGEPLRGQDVAERLGVPQSFVSKYETQRRRVDFVELEQIAGALDTTLLALVVEFEGNARPYWTVSDGRT
jgi:Helix-turn-helix domain